MPVVASEKRPQAALEMGYFGSNESATLSATPADSRPGTVDSDSVLVPSNRPRTLIIAPTYNERGNVEKFIYAVLSAMPWADILVIDDNSPDGTGSLADTFAMLLRQVRVLHRETKQGASTASIQGFEYAIAHGYDLVCELDTNSAYDPGGLPLLVELALDGDLVIGSSYMRNSQLPDWTQHTGSSMERETCSRERC